MLTFENLTSTTDADVSDDILIDSFTPADGYAYGIELFVQKTLGKLTGWIAYTNSIARKVMTSQLNETKEDVDVMQAGLYLTDPDHNSRTCPICLHQEVGYR